METFDASFRKASFAKAREKAVPVCRILVRKNRCFMRDRVAGIDFVRGTVVAAWGGESVVTLDRQWLVWVEFQ